jgi:hypothetical protein
MRKQFHRQNQNTALPTEVISRVRNPITGDVFDTSNIYESKIIDGNRFVVVWKPVQAGQRRDLKLMAASALEKVATANA